LSIDVYKADLNRSICDNVQMLKDGDLERIEEAVDGAGRGRDRGIR